jgi:hypothetical protein
MLQVNNEAHAQGADVQNVPSGNDKVIPIRKGEPAPIDGQLFDNDTALRWANWLVQYKNLVRVNNTYYEKVCSIDKDLAAKKLEIQEHQYQVVTADLQKNLSKAQDDAANPPFYKTFWFGATIGVAVSLATVVAAVEVAK